MSGPAPAAAPQPVTVQQLALMSPVDRQRILANADTNTQANWGSFQHMSNSKYLADTFVHEALCPMSNGGATSQNYVPGQALYFTVPVEDFAYLEKLRVYVSVNVQPTAGSGTAATYGLCYSAPLSLFDDVTIMLGNQQWDIPAFVLRDMGRWGGIQHAGQPRWVPNGYINSGQATFRTGALAQTTQQAPRDDFYAWPITVGAQNAWQFYFDIDLKQVHALDPRGMLPMFSNGVALQIILHCNGTIMGQDPLSNTLYVSNYGVPTGNVVNVTGNPVTYANGIVNNGVMVSAIYRDGKTPTSHVREALFLSNLGTMQVFRDQNLPQLYANQRMTQRVMKSSPRIYKLISYVVDGNQSTVPSLNTNIAELMLSTDQTGDNPLFHYGTGTNISPMSYFELLSQQYQQDFPDGVIPWIYATTQNTVNPDNREGVMFLDNSQSGYTSIYYGVKMNTVTTTTIQPRIETYIVYMNPQGLSVAGLV